MLCMVLFTGVSVSCILACLLPMTVTFITLTFIQKLVSSRPVCMCVCAIEVERDMFFFLGN